MVTKIELVKDLAYQEDKLIVLSSNIRIKAKMALSTAIDQESQSML